MSHGGKGDKPRPLAVPMEQFDKSWDAIFGKKNNETEDNQTERRVSDEPDGSGGEDVSKL